MNTTFIKIVILTVMNLTIITTGNAQKRRERFNLTVLIEEGSNKITLPINSYSYSLTNFKDRKDTSENGQHIYSGYFLLSEINQETNLSLLRMLASDKKINITILSKDSYSASLTNRRIEFKNVIFDINVSGTRQESYEGEGMSFSMRTTELVIDGVVFKR
jgi:hypothetical protein